jgi:hypothetical protein
MDFAAMERDHAEQLRAIIGRADGVDGSARV